MRKTRLSFAWGFFVWVLFAGLAVAQSTDAADWKVLSRSVRAQIEATESELSKLKLDVGRSFGKLEDAVGSTRQSADRWQDTANLESDPESKAIALGFRDGDNYHVKILIEIERLLKEVSRIDEALEGDQRLLRLLEKSLDDFAESLQGAKANGAQVSRLRETIALFQNDLLVSGEAILDLKKSLTDQAATQKEHDQKVQALLAELGNPEDRLKSFEKELVKSALQADAIQAGYLAIVSDHARRTSRIFLKTGDTLNTQERIVNLQ
jgi:tetratricopeptide (TPR) repeat protein